VNVAKFIMVAALAPVLLLVAVVSAFLGAQLLAVGVLEGDVLGLRHMWLFGLSMLGVGWLACRRFRALVATRVATGGTD
jgi:hypothetical protein